LVHAEQKNNIRYLDIGEWNCLDSIPKSERDSLILRLLYETGCTVNELVNIKRSDFEGNIIRIRPKHARNHEPRTAYISDTLLKEIRGFCRKKPEGDFLFSTRQSSCMTTKRIRQLVQKYCSTARIGRVNPQVLRYTHIVHAYQRNIPLDAIQRQVGLKRSRAIEIFEQLPELETKDAYKRFTE